MAAANQPLCNNDGECMVCKVKPSEVDKLKCKTCLNSWHTNCLVVLPETLSAAVQWECPDCTDKIKALTDGSVGENVELIPEIREIQEDPSLMDDQIEKNGRDLTLEHVTDNKGKGNMEEEDKEDDERTDTDIDSNALDIYEDIQCTICMQSSEKPSKTITCGHDFCLKCYEKWMAQGKDVCPKCEPEISFIKAKNERINLVKGMNEEAKVSKTEQPHRQKTSSQADRPDTAFTTERAKRAGLANASSGRIFVTVPSEHFGPITADNDPENNRGVLVGDCWKSRIEVRQWGVHRAPISGIVGQSKIGAQSVVLSGGYKDDEDQGEWFLYTGSGGKDLSGNKRTNKTQSGHQYFVKANESLRVSCMKGYPVRVIRSYKNKHSSYAPREGYRYDGIYRVERCWRKLGEQGFMTCRYLFIRCDNKPAPWKSEDSGERGDQPRPLPYISELIRASDECEREESPSWDFDVDESCWKWKKPPPSHEKTKNRKRGRRSRQSVGKFDCVICKHILKHPLQTTCGHSLCKVCLESIVASRRSLTDTSTSGHTVLMDNIFKCPYPQCDADISNFFQNPQLNTEQADLTEKHQHKRGMNVETSHLSDGEGTMEEGDALGGSDSEATS